MDTKRINATEWDLLEALWTLRRGTAREVTDAVAPVRDWAYSTVKTMLDRMAAKGLVEARQVGNVWEYAPAVDPALARRSAWKRFVEAAFGGAVGPALRFVAAEGGLTARERAELLAALGPERATPMNTGKDGGKQRARKGRAGSPPNGNNRQAKETTHD
ncbi:MAG: BlaI/MecI/CopY family transcriptional regulator [Phycisphaerales bacterium]